MKGQSSIDRRLARIEGQVGGLRRMLREGTYCMEVLTQIAAVRSALNQVGAEIASDHVEHCLMGERTFEEREPMSQEEQLAELRQTLSRLMK